jgi:hypothetical protein
MGSNSAFNIHNTRWKMRILKLLLLALLFILPVNNFILYNPQWGYDGAEHISSIIKIATEHHRANEGYASSNPPLYYYLAATIYKLTKSIKFIQFLSLISYLGYLFLLYRLIGLFRDNWFIKYSFTAFFSLLPLTINYAYMIYNYAWGHLFSLLGIYIILKIAQKRRMEFVFSVFLGLVTGFGILTSMTNLSLVAIVMSVFALFPKVTISKKIIHMVLFAVISCIIVMPYYNFKTKKYGDFLSAPNKGIKVHVKLTEMYPLKYFCNLNIDMFKKPFALNYLEESFWIRLHQTTYGDYWNYLVNARNSNENAIQNDRRVKEGKLFKTSPHYIDNVRIAELKILNYLGLPIALTLIVFFMISVYKTFFLFIRGDNEYITHFALVTTVIVFYLQFFAFIFSYPFFQCVHAGYTLPAFFALLLILVRNVSNKQITYILSAYLLLFAACSFYSFIN